MRYFYLLKHSRARQKLPRHSLHFFNMALQRYRNLQCHLRRFNHHIPEIETGMGLSYSKYKIIVKLLNTSRRKYYIWFKISTGITSTKITKSKKQWSFFFLFGWYSSFSLISRCQHLDLKFLESNICLLKPIC